MRFCCFLLLVSMTNTLTLLNNSGSPAVVDHKERVKMMTQILSEECPDKVQSDIAPAELSPDRYKQMYNTLLDQLIQCRKSQTTSAVTTTGVTPNQPVECQQAINYTQSWRLDHAGKNIKPGGLYSKRGYACDLQNKDWY